MPDLSTRPRRVLFAGVALAALGLTGCAAKTGDAVSAAAQSTSATAAPSSSAAGTITVLAAASLQEAFTTIGADFEKAHPGSTVTFSFGPSSGLATQIVNGSPADVFAAASVKTMTTVTDAKAAGSSTPFAVNSMEIAVPPSNPAHIAALADLARSGVKVAVCQADVPCGAAAATVLTTAKLNVKPISEEADVKSVLTKVELGEVDAGVVYVTDVKAAGSKVSGIAIPTARNTTTTYPIAALTKAPNPALARAFVGYVLSADAQKVLHDAGFAAP